MAEIVTLTVPVATPNLTTYRVVFLAFDWEAATIAIRLRGTNGESKSAGYQGAAATSLMTSLNKVDLSSNSLQRRVLARLISDGELAGTISGAPD